jgi:hypothetical protein
VGLIRFCNILIRANATQYSRIFAEYCTAQESNEFTAIF